MAAAPFIAAPANNVRGLVDHYEDSLFLKVFACVPVVGDFFRVNVNKELDRKYNLPIYAGEFFVSNMVKICEIKNNYKITGIIARILTISLIISVVALESASGLILGSVAAFIAVNITSIGSNGADMIHNHQTISDYLLIGTSQNGLK